jgi:hypothetical protein
LRPLGGNGSALTGACFLGVKLGELLALLAAERPSGTALLGGFLSQVEARQPIVDVRPPRAEIDRTAHRFAELAVIDDVDAGGGLRAHHVGDRRSQAREELAFGSIVPVELHQIIGPRQAADVGGENAIEAPLHVFSSRRLSTLLLAQNTSLVDYVSILTMLSVY